jgi:uncharacterized protein (TIGR02145 family)
MFMKRLTLSGLIISIVILMLFVALKTYAFDYNISFTASGARTSIDYIMVQNLTQGTTVTVPAGRNLEVTAINQVAANDELLHIYPNPIQNKSTVSFYSNAGGNTQINVFGVDGRNLVGMNKNLSFGVNQFQLSLPKGVFTIQINENGILHTAKVLSQSNNSARIEFTGNEKIAFNSFQKVKATTVPMQYNYGDFLLFKAYSGNYGSVLTDVITGNKTMNFNFVECKDVDGNYYSTVTIGSQVWMAENLKTSKYRNSIVITDKTNLTTWGTSTTEASSDYATPNNSTTYGKLYNWYAASNINNLAPLGWHIPTDVDWTNLSDFLGGLNLAGDKLKETGNSHWATANTTATNTTGFTAIPGGSRSGDNTIYDIGNLGYWWSSTEGTNSTNGWYRSLSNQNSIITRGYYSKSGGMSVRCVKGDIQTLTTSNISVISTTSAISGGYISYDGGEPITERGVCWSTTPNPSILDSKTIDGSGMGAFISTITGLSEATKYYFKAYATNSLGTVYGNELSFTTFPIIPDGFYIFGDATSFSTLDIKGQLKTTPNENLDNSGARAGLYDIYIALEGGKTFTITEVAGATKIVNGPGSGFATVNQTGNFDEMIGSIQKGKYAVGGTFTVPTSGLYHIGLDKTSTTVVIIPVTGWAIIGGATAVGWTDTPLPLKSTFSKDSLVYEGTDIVLTTGDFKFRHSGAWKQTIVGDPSVYETAYKINTSFGGTSMSNLIPGGANIPFATVDNGKYTVNATWGKNTGMKFSMIKTATIVVSLYPTNLYVVGTEYGNWTMSTPAATGIITMIPVNGHEWAFWAIVYSSGGSTNQFKFSSDNTVWGKDFGVTGTATNGIYVKGTDNITLATAGYYMLYVDLKANKISVTTPTVYAIGDAFGGYTQDVATNLFTINNITKTMTSPAAIASGNIRMYATCPLAAGDTQLADWWQMEFNIISGAIVYRGAGGD